VDCGDSAEVFEWIAILIYEPAGYPHRRYRPLPAIQPLVEELSILLGIRKVLSTQAWPGGAVVAELPQIA